jgi:hypothetical protein
LGRIAIPSTQRIFWREKAAIGKRKGRFRQLLEGAARFLLQPRLYLLVSSASALRRRGMNNGSGGTGGLSLDLNSVAAPSYGAMRTYTPKYCEMCGKSFLKLVISTVRDCAECRERTAKREAEMATPLPPERDVDYAKGWENRRARAAHALSMREAQGAVLNEILAPILKRKSA